MLAEGAKHGVIELSVRRIMQADRRQLSLVGFCFVSRDEFQRGRIHAIAQIRWRWTVVEHVAQMRVALRTGNRRSDHAEGRVADFPDSFGCNRSPETRPAGS